MSNLPSVTLPVWQTKHRFLKTGSMSRPYSTGSVRLRSTVGIGGKSLSFFGSWVVAAWATKTIRANAVNRRMGNLGCIGERGASAPCSVMGRTNRGLTPPARQLLRHGEGDLRLVGDGVLLV